jgi:hypothetical protein
MLQRRLIKLIHNTGVQGTKPVPYCSCMSTGIETYSIGLLGKRSMNGCWQNLWTQKRLLGWSAVELLAMHPPPLKAGVGGVHKECELVGRGRYPKMRRFSKARTVGI